MEQSKANFSDWYHEVLETAEIIDSRYNIKGTYAWRPFGFQLRKLVFDELRRQMDGTGHDETLFPLLIPEDQLMKEAKHIKGFEDGVYWVTKGGLADLDVPLAIRPTSETAMYPLFALWIRTHADLPLKIYQIVNVFRYETKHTRPLIRDREVSTFKEAHCAHPDQKGVDEEMETMQKAYNKFFDALRIPAFVVDRPEWDRFPGANKTVAWDVVMPDNKTLQCATSHDLGTKFAKTFNVTYEDAKGEQQFCHLNSHGISSRIIAALVAVHGDENGLILPPEFAPVQAVVVPVVFKGDKKKVLSEAKKAFDSLSCRKKFDDSDDSPGNKYYKWELRGVPVRVEIGPKDIENKEAVLVRRDTRKKKTVKLKDLDKEVQKLLKDITKSMKEKASDFHEGTVAKVKTADGLKDSDKAGLPVLVPVCSSAECWKKMEEGLRTLEFRGTLVGKKGSGKCISCDNSATAVGLFSNAY